MNLKRTFKIWYEDHVIGRYLKRYNYDTKNQFKSNDVFLVGYPKSGNTWLQNLVAGLIYGIDTQYLPDQLTQELVPPVKNRRIFKRFLPFNCFKSHELPDPSYRRVILLVRDGRDVLPSYKSMNEKLGKKFSLEQMVKESKGVYPCGWADFYRKWNQNPYEAELMVLKYEDLFDDIINTLKEVCKFLKIDRDESLLKKVSEGNSIINMRSKAKAFGTDHRNWKEGDAFFRKGKVGSFEEDFDGELLDYFVSQSKDVLSYFEYL